MGKGDKIYDMINERIFELLEKGEIPWHKTWKGGSSWAPANLASKREYRGINIFLLASSGFSSRYWLTYKQAQEKGGQVRKGEKGFPVIFWKWEKKEEIDRQNGEKSTASYPILRYYTVFNIDQIDGIDNPDMPAETNEDFNPIAEADRIVQNMPNKPNVRHGEARAFYRPSADMVNMPLPQLFDKEEYYYATLFHELTHATGHENRLRRQPSTEIRHFGDREYSQEELVAEMGSAFLCGMCGIEQQTIENAAAYIQSWLGILRNNKKMLVNAAAQAQKAADYILGRAQETPAATGLC